MPFKKGQSGNPAGKPKGAVNKTDEHLREFLRQITADYFNGADAQVSFINDIKSLRPGMRTQVMEKYLKYFLAPMASLKIEGDVNVNQSGTIKIDFSFGDKDVDDDMKNIIANI